MADLGGGRVATLDRTFDAVVFDWDGTAVRDRDVGAGALRRRVQALCACAVDHRGPRLLSRRTASPEEQEALDRAVASVIQRLAERGLAADLVSARLNRRKIDLIAEPAWADPPKAHVAELLEAVTGRLHAAGIPALSTVVEPAHRACEEVGLAEAPITSDVKHVEIGLTDKSDSMRALLRAFAERGIGPGLTLVVGDEFRSLGGVAGSDSLVLVPEAARATAVSVGGQQPGPGHPADAR